MNGGSAKVRRGEYFGTNILIHKSLRWLRIAGEALAVATLILWIGDWGMFRVRSAHGDGLDSVQVQQYLGTPLKGSKVEYDFLGTAQVPCARSLFPHAGAEPCWWVRRHTTVWE